MVVVWFVFFSLQLLCFKSVFVVSDSSCGAEKLHFTRQTMNNESCALQVRMVSVQIVQCRVLHWKSWTHHLSHGCFVHVMIITLRFRLSDNGRWRSRRNGASEDYFVIYTNSKNKRLKVLVTRQDADLCVFHVKLFSPCPAVAVEV